MKKTLDTNPHKGDGVTYPAEVARQWKKERDEARDIACKLLRIAEARGPRVWGPRPEWLTYEP
jgi:hypothetical protein